jgi:pimeloyl-ACP methyl ester carboxylesterase
MRSSCAAFASGVVISFAHSRRRNMLVASASSSSGACSKPLARTSSAQSPQGPLSTRAATTTDESMTTLNAGQRFCSQVSAWVRCESASCAFSCAPAEARPLSTGGRPIAPVRSAGIPASTYPAMPHGRLIRRGLLREHHDVKGVSIPVAVSAFPDEIDLCPRSWAERAYPKLIHYNKLDRGGHFAAWEQPTLFTEELRAGFRPLRGS